MEVKVAGGRPYTPYTCLLLNYPVLPHWQATDTDLHYVLHWSLGAAPVSAPPDWTTHPRPPCSHLLLIPSHLIPEHRQGQCFHSACLAVLRDE